MISHLKSFNWRPGIEEGRWMVPWLFSAFIFLSIVGVHGSAGAERIRVASSSPSFTARLPHFIEFSGLKEKTKQMKASDFFDASFVEKTTTGPRSSGR